DSVRYEYDDAGNVVHETVENGTDSRTTDYTYDQSGLTTSKTDPAGNKTEYGYDELGRPVSVTAPAVLTESGGAAPATARPTTFTGYDTFGAVTESLDALGNLNRTAYDRLGRPVTETAPAYTAPGSTETVAPTVTHTYDALGNVTESTDPLGRVTRFRYDRQNRLTVKDVPVGTGDERGQWTYTYTRTGEILSVTDPGGARAETTYDDLDRPVTTTRIERRPTPGAYTTRNEYDDAGNVVRQISPSGADSRFTYDRLGQLTRMEEPGGVVTRLGYDAEGREVRRTDGMGRSSAKIYDQLGQLVQDQDLDPAGNLLRKVGYTYDKAGNLVTSTNPLNRATTYTYDALNRLTSQTEPVSDTKSITTSFGYDALGNRTRYTDGRGNSTIYTFNSLGLAESVIEPATDRDPAPQARTWATAYDAAGQPVKVTAPGGVVRERAYDKAGQLIRETGTGAGTATAERQFEYDAAGRLTKASSPKGDNTYEYDDRGALLKATGPLGDATYAYDGDGRLTSRTDAAGTALFGYAGRQLTSATDPLTGVRQTYGYDGAGALEKVDYGAGRSRGFTYDDLGRLDTDTLKNSAGRTMASTDYGYDDDDRLTSKTTTGTAKAGTSTYGYDQAGRLTSWTADGTTTAYGWDDSGNRVKNGAKTATFDERNRLLSDGDYTYDYTSRGTLASRTSSGLKEDFTFDAFDRLVKAGESGTEYTYDSLDRIASRNGADFSYAGFAPDPVKDQTATYGRGAADELLSVAEGGGPARLTLEDKHGDVVGSMSAADGAAAALDESTAFDPFGRVLGTTGTTGSTDTAGTAGNVGYQGDWTDPDTDQVDMQSRWYDPGTGTFDSRDSYLYDSGASILANRYTYGAGAPLDYTDPDGHWPSCGWCSKAASWTGKKIRQGASWTGKKIRQGARYVAKTAKTVWHGVQWAWNNPGAAFKLALNYVGKAAGWVYRKSGLKTVVDATVDAVKWVGQKTGVTQWAREKARQAIRAAYQAKVYLTKKARQAASFAARHNPIPAIVAATKPLIAVGKAIVTADPNLPAIIVGAAVQVVADAAKAADAIRDEVVKQVGSVVETVSDAVDWGEVWDDVKTVGNFVGDVTGFNDIKDCVTTGDMESCAWAAATVGGIVLGGAGAAAVRAAKAGRMTAKAAKYADQIAKAAEKGKKALDEAESIGECVSTVRDVASLASGNSFVPGTEVVMADGSRKPIEEVEEGDEVLATDPTTGRTSKEKVTGTIEGRGAKNLVSVTIDTDGDRGRATDTLTATEGHPFWVPDLKKWLKAEELRPGQWLRTGSGTRVEIEAVTAWTQQAAVYNLTVDRAHTYYVLAGATPVLVHNCGDVFRSDTRDPSVIFDGGFAPKGDNMNLEEHVAGVSGVYTPDSGYVATTTMKSHAMSRKGHTYVIDSRGAAGGIDVNKAIPGNVHANEAEIAVPRAIDSCHIRGCWHETTGEWIPNPNYRE
ncbi:polymorphic toxin-type HINT domain-containing protein, partial [Streptomyces eurythermus]